MVQVARRVLLRSWPDEDTATYCTIIETTYQKWSSCITILLTGIIIIGLLFTFYTTIFYILNCQEKIIKATTRELCSIILAGIFIAYLTPLFYFFKPVYWSCIINRHGFNLSVIIIYSPFFVQTNSVQDFPSWSKGNSKTKIYWHNNSNNHKCFADIDRGKFFKIMITSFF